MTTVRVTVSFNIERQQWSHVFDAERGSTIWQLKKQMLTPKGTDEDINAFELQLLSCRVPDWEQIHLDQTLEFNYLGPEEGERRAKQDMLERETSAAPASTSHDKHIIQGTPQASAPLPVGEPAVGGECVVSGGSGNDSIQALYTAAARPPTTQPAPALAQWWEVVGGADKGGILVRGDVLFRQRCWLIDYLMVPWSRSFERRVNGCTTESCGVRVPRLAGSALQ